MVKEKGAKEKRRLFNAGCEPTERFYYAGEEKPEGLFSMVAMIAIENKEGEFLMQKRSKFKTQPLTWSVTMGHPTFDETNIQGIIREVKEEIGLDVSHCKIKSFWKGFDDRNRGCREMFFVKKDVDLNKLVLQPEEVVDVAWFSKNKILTMIENQELMPAQIDFFKKLFDWGKDVL